MLASSRTLLLALPLIVAACAPAGTPSASPAAPGAAATDPAAASSAEVWRTAELRDVRSGETFRLGDLQGRVVMIEPMAIWCLNCRIQHDETRTALANVNSKEFVYISLDVDPNETEAELARYADEHGYSWSFAVASREVARSLAQTFGDQVLSPPSTPNIIISVDGSAEVRFGIRRAAQLEADVAARLP